MLNCPWGLFQGDQTLLGSKEGTKFSLRIRRRGQIVPGDGRGSSDPRDYLRVAKLPYGSEERTKLFVGIGLGSEINHGDQAREIVSLRIKGRAPVTLGITGERVRGREGPTENGEVMGEGEREGRRERENRTDDILTRFVFRFVKAEQVGVKCPESINHSLLNTF